MPHDAASVPRVLDVAAAFLRLGLTSFGGPTAHIGFFRDEFVRRYGVSKPFFFIYDADAPAAILQKQSFMAIARTIGDPVKTHHDNHSLMIEIYETF